MMAANDGDEGGERKADMADLLISQIDQFSIGERLRLAAELMDKVKHGAPNGALLVSHARQILKLVDGELLKMQRGRS